MNNLDVKHIINYIFILSIFFQLQLLLTQRRLTLQQILLI